ncbi:hypothetical protein [Flavisolibacter tropicus]|uniref:Uncharacterized protein n=1 Tax=Flavisolibacter tropicus TaxID=1492898 RepID=A0A172TSI3_9BACT|nr:hypothetical protein [Flavisolibacter tropicus]ANE49938.1 hypothetical protein SY85_04935 [Flavisolibacter tropicus]
MILHIDDSMTIAEIQEKFEKSFPALKIEFYKKPHHFKESSPAEQLIDPNTVIASIHKTHDPGNLIIFSTDSAGHIENEFKKLFGLNVQIFQKVNGAWIQTNNTDNNSLKNLSDLSSGLIH